MKRGNSKILNKNLNLEMAGKRLTLKNIINDDNFRLRNINAKMKGKVETLGVGMILKWPNTIVDAPTLDTEAQYAIE